jgi:hypothetical protein
MGAGERDERYRGMTDKLLDCPFCGAEAWSREQQYRGPWKICCDTAGCPVYPEVTSRSEAEAITAWNTRATLTEHQPAPVAAPMQKLANLQTAYLATAEAAATHLNAAMDAQDKLAIALSALDAIYSEATREYSRDHHLRRCAIVQAGQVLGK